MKPALANRDANGAEQPGLSEEAAACAVIGVEIEALGTVVGRHWGLGDDVMHMVRRLPRDAPVRRPDSDAEVLRLTASAANDVVDAVAAAGNPTGPRAVAAIGQVAQRYARALGVSARDVGDALQAAREALRKGVPLPTPRRGDLAGATAGDADPGAAA